jgi:DNA-binding transcriptional MocR family regulator
MQDDDLYAIWPLRLARGSGPRYRQIADLIERAVAENRLQPGDRLPPQRGLAQRLGIDLTTVTRGYNEAGLRGLLDPRGAAGTFISRRAEPAALVLDLGMNLPPPPLGCDMQELLRRGLARVMERQDVHVLMTYQLAGGSAAERAAGAQWLSEAAEPADAEHVLVTPGAQAALAAVILACGRAGDAIVSEPLVYPGLLAAAEQLGRRVVVAETDDEGMTPTGLERACRESGSRLVYLNPTLQNPTTRTLTEARRCDLLRAAAACGAQVIEDDPYRLFLDAAPPTMASLAPASVFHISTLAKCLTPGLRTAYVLAPDLDSRAHVLASMRSFALMATPLMSALAAQWIASGAAQDILDGVRAEAQARQLMARRVLQGAAVMAQDAPAEGIHQWLSLPAPWTANALARAARDQGLSVASSDAFRAGVDAPNAIRVSLGAEADRAQLEQALGTLAGLMRSRPQPPRVAVV